MSDFDTFDLYQVLGVDRDASEAEIRDAFNRAALTEHPDRSGHPDAEERIRRVYQARDTLLNARLRAAYDPDADQRSRREAQERERERERQAPPQPPPRQPPPRQSQPHQPTPPPQPRQPQPPTPRQGPADSEDDRNLAQEQLRSLAGSTILTQRRWFRADSDRQHYYVAAYAEFLRQEQRYLTAWKLGPGLCFALFAIGSFGTGGVVGGVVLLIMAIAAFVACRYLAEREWFIWLYLILAVPTVQLAKLIYAALQVAFHFTRSQLQQRWQARARSSQSDD